MLRPKLTMSGSVGGRTDNSTVWIAIRDSTVSRALYKHHRRWDGYRVHCGLDAVETISRSSTIRLWP